MIQLKIFFFFGLLLNTLCLCATAQNFEIGILNGALQQRESLINTSNYKGYKFGIWANFDKRLKNKNVLRTNLNLLSSISSWNNNGNELFQIEPNVEIAYQFPINHAMLLGPSVQSKYQYSLYSLNYEHPFWFTQYSLNISGQFVKKLTENLTFRINYSVPIIGFLSRPEEVSLYTFKKEYTQAYFNKNLEIASFNSFQAASINIAIERHFFNKSNLILSYTFNGYSYSEPKSIKSLFHAIGIGITRNRKNEK